MKIGIEKLALAIFVCLLFSNCSHRIVRTGYKTTKSAYKACDVVIKKSTEIYDSSSAIKVGEIKLGESGFSTACNEALAIKILKGEACAINADVIIITEEWRPDLWSTCYRCKAEFYQVNSKSELMEITPDKSYDTEQVSERVSKDRSKNTAIIIVAVVAGLLVGLLSF